MTALSKCNQIVQDSESEYTDDESYPPQLTLVETRQPESSLPDSDERFREDTSDHRNDSLNYRNDSLNYRNDSLNYRNLAVISDDPSFMRHSHDQPHVLVDSSTTHSVMTMSMFNIGLDELFDENDDAPVRVPPLQDSATHFDFNNSPGTAAMDSYIEPILFPPFPVSSSAAETVVIPSSVPEHESNTKRKRGRTGSVEKANQNKKERPRKKKNAQNEKSDTAVKETELQQNVKSVTGIENGKENDTVNITDQNMKTKTKPKANSKPKKGAKKANKKNDKKQEYSDKENVNPRNGNEAEDNEKTKDQKASEVKSEFKELNENEINSGNEIHPPELVERQSGSVEDIEPNSTKPIDQKENTNTIKLTQQTALAKKPVYRVGLSKRVRVDSLHAYLKR